MCTFTRYDVSSYTVRPTFLKVVCKSYLEARRTQCPALQHCSARHHCLDLFGVRPTSDLLSIQTSLFLRGNPVHCQTVGTAKSQTQAIRPKKDSVKGWFGPDKSPRTAAVIQLHPKGGSAILSSQCSELPAAPTGDTLHRKT